MTLADKITSLRIVFAPIFFGIYLLPSFFPVWFAGGAQWTVPVLWFLFIVSEITDMIDGKVARKRNEVSDFGKFYDPFADTLVQLTYFLCFVMDRVLPVVLYLVVLYREFSILFIRNLMLKKGVAMGARKGGKIKTVAYISAGAFALASSSAARLGLDPRISHWLGLAAVTVFALSVLAAILSLGDYISVYRKTPPA
ncbi:MAG: CDP-diacylglycerol--glycerol-3-phosphate 3-phosphatidyltransferase [Treponema sp.]|jgi:CDP-diacylglycerol--glycerol-3-phosphate 3-phosphatidyltransferase|nr:CDP-diacylglycerol--glycerol-3-phosphate 3-phosphatidyltransferase [Treponema sp.]